MNKIDKQYTDLLQDILDNGIKKQDRTGTGTISVFGRQIRHDMKDGFPLITTKKMPFKTIVTELLWFLRGDTNIKYLVDNNCHIWNGDAYKNYLKVLNSDNFINNWIQPEMRGGALFNQGNNGYTLEEFINEIKTDDEFAKNWGELGPIYGKQWRSWGISQKVEEKMSDGRYRFVDKVINPIDQIQNLINDLKTNPDSRRLMVSAWNVGELAQMVLPPCHYGFQVYTRELSLEERAKWLQNNKGYDLLVGNLEHDHIREVVETDSPTRAISLMWNQRSVDTFLGLPFNIASYGLLLEIIAKEVNMVPDELIGNLGDVHLYLNHIEQAKEQIGRELNLNERNELLNTKINQNHTRENCFSDKEFERETLIDCKAFDIPKRTREPFPLPTLKINPNNKMRIGGGIFTYDRVDFEVENYQSHTEIKAPLSN